MTLRMGALALILVAAVASTACDGDSGLAPGSSTFGGNLSEATTGDDTSLGGMVVAVRGSSESTGITDDSGNFVVSGAPTGDVQVFFRRGACESGFPLQSVPSRSTVTLTDVVVECDTATPDGIFEMFEAVLRDRPGSPDDLDTCIRAGRDQRRRNVSAKDAEIERADGSPATFGDLDDDDRLAIEGERPGTGAPGTLLASRIRILERDVNDPCDDDPFE